MEELKRLMANQSTRTMRLIDVVKVIKHEHALGGSRNEITEMIAAFEELLPLNYEKDHIERDRFTVKIYYYNRLTDQTMLIEYDVKKYAHKV